jgi:hypothetical protein
MNGIVLSWPEKSVVSRKLRIPSTPRITLMTVRHGLIGCRLPSIKTTILQFLYMSEKVCTRGTGHSSIRHLWCPSSPPKFMRKKGISSPVSLLIGLLVGLFSHLRSKHVMSSSGSKIFGSSVCVYTFAFLLFLSWVFIILWVLMILMINIGSIRKYNFTQETDLFGMWDVWWIWWFYYNREKKGESQGDNVTLELWCTVSR